MSVRIERLHACFGVLCERHRTCARYLFGDGSREPSIYWLATCAPHGSRERPGYIDVDFIGPPHVLQYSLTRRSAMGLESEQRKPVFAQA